MNVNCLVRIYVQANGDFVVSINKVRLTICTNDYISFVLMANFSDLIDLRKLNLKFDELFHFLCV